MIGIGDFDYLAGQSVGQQQEVSVGEAAATEEAASVGGQVPAWDGASYVPVEIVGETGGVTISFDGTARTLTIQLPQALGTAAEPTFAGLKIGSSGTKLTLVKQRSYTIDFGSVSAHSVLDSVQAFTGVDPTKTVLAVVAPDAVMAANNLAFTAWVSDTDAITIRAVNPTTGAIDPGSGDYLVVAYVF